MIRKALARIRTIRRRIRPYAPVQKNFRQALATLDPEKVAIDCGANVGAYTVMLARTGAQVHAFEPNPHAFSELSWRVKKYKNVTLYNNAVSSRDGTAQLYFHKQAHEDPEYHSPSASLEAVKSNIDTDNYVNVEIIDFGAFVMQFSRIALLKMDIEGHEVSVLNHLIDCNLIERIELAFVELHDHDHPAFKASSDKLRDRLADFKNNFDLTWH